MIGAPPPAAGLPREGEPTRAPQRLPRLAAPRVVVLLHNLERGSLRALDYARAIAALPMAVLFVADRDEAGLTRRRWKALELEGDVELMLLDSAGGSDRARFNGYLDALETREHGRLTVVVLPELLPSRRWMYPLRNLGALMLRLQLLRRPRTAVVSIPYSR